jgi:hypothetical protein
MYMYTNTHDSYTLQCMPQKEKGWGIAMNNAQNGNMPMTPVLLFHSQGVCVVGNIVVIIGEYGVVLWLVRSVRLK